MVPLVTTEKQSRTVNKHLASGYDDDEAPDIPLTREDLLRRSEWHAQGSPSGNSREEWAPPASSAECGPEEHFGQAGLCQQPIAPAASGRERRFIIEPGRWRSAR